ncbi:MAG: 3-dehydroquinate synthase [Propionibacteriaceae bacterium]|nr:3-dehydroquinate synthase [Propionibacteriaceae bacterium]
MSIVFVGLPASGKTTIGAAVAARLGVTWLDTDTMVEDYTGQAITEIFADDGEARFRELEERAAAEALRMAEVVCLGGGAVMTPSIRAMLGDHRVVWLDVSVTTLTRRAGMNRLRPLLLTDVRAQMTQLASERLPVLAEVATWRVDAERGVDDVVDEILSLVCPAQTIRVAGEQPYDVLIGWGVSSQIADHLGQAAMTAIIYPEVLAERARHLAQRVPGPILLRVPDAEHAKTAEILDQCWNEVARAGLTRSDAVVSVGGGATTDLAGFVAATYLRGIRHVCVPTTVLGMADAAVGGKTGINLPVGKNLVGAFHEPAAVLCDLDLLAGLPTVQVRSGLAEVLKCGFIADPVILESVGRDPRDACDTQSDAFVDQLARAISVKARVVSTDFKETGVGGVGREALNYGHTLGHAIEKLEGFTWPHGNAVAVGMVFAAEVAHRLGMIDADTLALHRTVLESVGLPIVYSGAGWAEVRSTMSLDKKSRGSHLRLVLLQGIGHPVVVADVDDTVLHQAFEAIGGV